MGMIAHRCRERVAGLRHTVAAGQHLARRGIASERGGSGTALEDIEPERGIADRPGHHDAIAGSGADAVDHFAPRHPAERGDRDHCRARRGNRIAAEQRAIKGRGVLAQRLRERL